MKKLQKMMHRKNKYVKIFKTHLENIETNGENARQMTLILKDRVRSSQWDNRTFELPTSVQLSAIIDHPVHILKPYISSLHIT